MKKYFMILVAACHIYSLTINVNIIVGQSQSVLVRAEGASVTSINYGFLVEGAHCDKNTFCPHSRQ